MRGAGPGRVVEETLRRGLAAGLFAVALAWAAVPAAADPQGRIAFRRLGQDDGLLQGSIHAIAQDRRGFMWFGTQEGLHRFDGAEFRVFTHDSADPGSISHNRVRAILEDRSGALWIGTQGGGLNRFDPQTERFTRFVFDPADPGSISHDRIRFLYEDSAGVLWVGTDGGGLDRFDAATETFTPFSHDPSNPASLSHDRVSTLLEDSRGTLWVGTDGGGLARLDRETGAFETLRHDPGDPASLGDDRVRCLFLDPAGRLWVGTYEGGLSVLDPETGAFRHFRHDADDPHSLNANRVRDIFEDRDGTLWIGTDGGLSQWDPAGEQFRQIRHNPADPLSLSDDRVTAVFQDRGGVLWVGTYDGLNRWNPLTGNFAHFKSDPKVADSLSSNLVMAFHDEPDGSIWVGTYGGGLDLVEPESGVVERFRSHPARPRSLSDDRVMSLLVDSRGTLWAGTFDGGLNRLDRRTGTFRRYLHDPRDPTSLSADGVTAILEDRSGILWIGTYRGGLNRYDPALDAFTSYRSDPDRPNSLSSDRVVALYEDSWGLIWVGTDGGGLNRFDPASGRFTHFRHDPADPSSLSGDTIWTVHEDRRGTLWIGTETGGFSRWLPEDRRGHRPHFRRFTRRDGLLSSVVYGILSDRAGQLWLSTNRGLSSFDPVRETFRHFDTSHGLQSNEFNAGAYFETRDGKMLFGGPNGFNAFYPAAVALNRHVPPVEITAFRRFNERLDLGGPLSTIDRVELTHRDSVIGFEFVALDFTAPEKNRYAYRLEGFDEAWIEAGNMRQATYTNLDPGAYTFRVRGSNNDGVWSEIPAELAIAVAPPPWRSRWAYSVYGLLAAAFLLGLVRFQVREREKAAELAEANRSLQLQMTERERAQGEIRKLSLAVEQSPASVMITDPAGKIEYVNAKFEELTGYRRDEVLGRRSDFLESGYTAPGAYRALWDTVRAGRDWRGELHSKKKSGELFWEYASVSPLKSADGAVTHVLAVNEDITVRKEYEERLLHQAHFDHLTNLPNRILALDRLSRAIVQNRKGDRVIGVMFVDLDNFKIVNDTLGHATGDELLVASAARLNEVLRASDTVARLGGDEFLVILPELDDVVDAEVAAGRLLESFARPFNLDGRDIFVTASVGITVAPIDGDDPHILLRNADAAMYKAKEAGRNAYQFFTPAMNEQAMHRLSLESNLRRALGEEQLAIRYQPLIDAETEKVVGAEALLTWDSPELGKVTPDEFIPVAEETGLIVPIGEWVLREACRAARSWRDATGLELRVAVNVSARQLMGAELAEATARALAESGLEPGCLELEITERLLMEDDRETMETLHRLRELGVRLSLDDFGTGYSALGYLKKYPFDVLKIDRAFVASLLEKSGDRALVKAVIAMGRSLDLEVIAEGVEEEEQLELLREWGCDLLQGHLFSRAVPAEAVPDLELRARSRPRAAPSERAEAVA